jgi:peroxiredoxin
VACHGNAIAAWETGLRPADPGSTITIANRNTLLINPAGNIAMVYTKVDQTVQSDGAEALADITTMQSARYITL